MRRGPIEARRRRVDRRRLGTRRQVAELLLDPLLRLRRIEVADHAEAGVVRQVVAVEEGLHVRDRRGLQVLVLADHADLVGMARRVHELVDQDLGLAVGLVLDALPPLVAHDVALQVELLLGHRLVERLEPVGLEPQQRLEHRRGAPVEVVRAVLAGRGVVRAAAGLHDRVELRVRHAVRAHEHEVLEEVREARAPQRLVLAADAVPQVDLDLGQAVVGREDHVEAVVEPVALVRHADAACRGRGRGGGRRVLRRGRREDRDEQERQRGQHGGLSSEGGPITVPCPPRGAPDGAGGYRSPGGVTAQSQPTAPVRSVARASSGSLRPSASGSPRRRWCRSCRPR
jgi:hypothetical protein